MTEWLTAREIAEMRLPGLAHSKRKINEFATRNGWHSAMTEAREPLARKREGRGGGFEFHVSLLPQIARSRLEARAGRDRKEHEIARDLDLLKASDVTRRDARLFVLARADEFHRAHPDLNLVQALEAYASAFNAKTAAVPDWVRNEIGEMSGRTLRRWRAFREASRLDQLAGRYSVREGSREIERMKDGEVATFIGGLIVKQPFLTVPHIRLMVQGHFGLDLSAMPSERTFQRFVTDWKDKNSLALLKLTNPDGYKSKARLSGNNSNGHVTALNQLWEIDASPADVLTTDGRHAVYVAIDIWSRRMMVLVTKTPRTEATLLLIRRAILSWGVPATIKTDNGSDFTSRRFVSAMNSVGIAHETSDAFSPEQKGTVERAIGTLQRGLMRVLPGFVGHSVADRKVIEQRKAFSARLGTSDEHTFQVEISAADLQRYCDEWCENTYAHHAHKGLDGMSPFAKAASFRGRIDRIENERALDLLLAPIAGQDGWRQVTKQGVSLDKAWFISPHLMPGVRVFCRQDPEDMGRLHCFESEAGAFITTAICPERAGIDPKAAIKAAREQQAATIAEQTAEMRSAARKIKPRDMVDWLNAGSRRNSASVTAFPQRSETYSNDALAAAGDATSDDFDVPVVAPETSPQLVQDNVLKLPETAKQRFTRAVRLEACVKHGDPVSTEEAMWLGSYQATAEYRSHQMMLEDFGPEAVLEKS
jgi:transposase InsO family protein